VNTRPGDPRFYRLLDEIANLHARKSKDYSPAADPLKNFRASADYGVRPYLGVLTRLGDKAGRIATFARSGELQNESARDSHIDSAVYHLIAVLLLEDEAEAKANAYGCMGDPDPEPAPVYLSGCSTCGAVGGHEVFCPVGRPNALTEYLESPEYINRVTVAGSDEPTAICISDDPLPAFGPGSPAATGAGKGRVYAGEENAVVYPV
jgi:hypothetical protein